MVWGSYLLEAQGAGIAQNRSEGWATGDKAEPPLAGADWTWRVLGLDAIQKTTFRTLRW